jgi:hypothetical protein
MTFEHLLEFFPVEALSLTTPIKPLEPHPLYSISEFVQSCVVPCKAIIIVVPFQNSAQKLIEFPEG